jgi:N-acetyl-gamma-glutamyl-phosphate reductase
MYPNLCLLKDRLYEDLNVPKISKESDVVFLCLPHGASAEVAKKFFDDKIKVIDLSADFRYKDIAVYEDTYKVTHPAKALNACAVYGLPELYKKDIAKADIVANPGCYTTTSILSLYPLLKDGLVGGDNIIIDAKSGVSGAGKKVELSYNFCEQNENFKAYSVTVHRHTSEIEQELSLAAGRRLKICFTPHLLPVNRGIFATIYCDLSPKISDAQIEQSYKKFYKNAPFVKINDSGIMPELKNVRGSNMCEIGFKADRRLSKLIICGVTDNLIKGASGQAVQNMNLMFGLDESCGLTFCGSYL